MPLSSAGLGRLDQAMAEQVARGVVPGLVALVASGDQVHVAAAGVRDLDDGTPMRRDSLCRIASMTKPITAVAALMLVEDGVLRLGEPVDRWLPELADRRVLRCMESSLDDAVPARRPITLDDLLSFRAGFGVIMAPPGRYPIQQAIADAGLSPGPVPPALAPDALAAAYGALPLLHQPGEGWMYNTGSELLGVLVARAAGQPFEDVLAERIFAPLGMLDTGYEVAPDRRDRLAGVYQADPDTGAFVRWPGSDARVFPGGGTGLVSTVDDYLAFARLLLNQGRHDGHQLLAPGSVALMTSDRLTAAQKAASPLVPGFWDGRGWGYGLGVTLDPDAALPRGYGWDGGLGTSWRTDPAAGLTGILLTQRPMTSPALTETATAFWHAAYGATA